MPNSFSKLYIHHVSAVKYRQALILPSFEEELYKYIVGIIKNLGQTPLQVNGMPDHIHIAARLRPDMAPATFVQKVKANSSKWINDQGFLPQKFSWQTGGGTFSVSRTHVDAVRYYIKNQKAHHAKKSFRKEYLDILKKHEIEPDAKYLPDFFED
ncbi:IS200/IS605 family transposase [Phaeodactylibacter luteus]|uniref:IS200/IS605 family transposase n=1 Tax=Phaeodactylibacter luteus TaxID=1564516 RepID=A0A5C6S1Q4_9BACT|nr:IS200/IS605 family transposase [Phaeodactylibacter luteus]TXB68354.1 IS200/IS605 family transposase [Phaeodactylibacter luteus]